MIWAKRNSKCQLLSILVSDFVNWEDASLLYVPRLSFCHLTRSSAFVPALFWLGTLWKSTVAHRCSGIVLGSQWLSKSSSYYQGNQINPVSVSLIGLVMSSLPHYYCPLSNLGHCTWLLGALTFDELFRNALGQTGQGSREWASSKRDCDPSSFSPCFLIVAGLFLLLWASKSTGFLVMFFVLPALVKNSKCWSYKVLVWLSGEMCVVNQIILLFKFLKYYM